MIVVMTVIKCRQCKKDKQETDFRLFRGRRNKTCIECRVKNNLWYSKDLGGRKTKAKEYYQKRKPLVAKYRSDLRLDRKYSLTREDWNTMLAEQDNKCLICDCEFNKYKPCVDHSHETGKVRGLLCRRCNLKLSVVEDKDFVKNAEIYLESMK